jgi:hypothetical protein
LANIHFDHIFWGISEDLPLFVHMASELVVELHHVSMVDEAISI